MALTQGKVREHIGRCAGSIRHWWTLHGAVGAKRAVCGHCRAMHPDILKALQRGRYYLNLYEPPDDSPDAARTRLEIQRDARLLDDAIERIGNEEQA